MEIGEAYPRRIPQKVLEAYPQKSSGSVSSVVLVLVLVLLLLMLLMLLLLVLVAAPYLRIIPEAYPKHACNCCGVLRVHCLDLDTT